MTMAIDQQQRQFGGLNFDHLPYTMSNAPPQFTNPWTSSTSAPQSNASYASAHSQQQQQQPQPHGLSSSLGLDSIAKQQAARNNSNVSMQSYASVPPITSASAGSSLLVDVYGTQQDLLTLSQDLLSSSRIQPTSAGYASDTASYASSASPATSSSYGIPSSAPYEHLGYAPAPMRSTYALSQPQQQTSPEHARRHSQSSSAYGDMNEPIRDSRPTSFIDYNDRSILSHENTRGFGDAIDASRGMIAMSQNTTPRNIYGPGGRSGRGSTDSYGFPSTHSTNSSISSSSDYPSYFAGPGSVHSSVSDYSNAGSDIESVSSRTLPRPSGLLHGGVPPAPQSMMGQFSSKVSSSTQKKHKCKVCDKRFTRPSSLQTHMYSHTGEKPFHCKVEGCGRNFSVVSNLRRHRKVHKGEAQSEAGSEDPNSDD